MVSRTFDPNLGDGLFLVGPNDPNRSNENIVLAATTVELPAGTALGKVTASGKYVPWAPAAADGSQNLAGFLWGRRPISTGDQRAAMVARDATVNGNLVTYINVPSAPQLAAAIAAASANSLMIRK